MPHRVALRVAVAALCASLSALTLAQTATPRAAGGCGQLKNAFGPFDYRTQRENLEIVESNHFLPQVEMHIKGMTGKFGGDIDYTLRAFPNHHRALLSMSRLATKEKTVQPAGASYTVDCYFDRAMRMAKDDLIVRMLFAEHLNRNNRREEALTQLDHVAATAGENGLTHFNAGLLYLDMQRFDKARAQAHTAMALGMQRTELRDALKKAGKWTEPPPVSSAPPVAEPAAGRASEVAADVKPAS